VGVAGYVLLVNVAATLYMVGVIWFVQIVHYPLFGNVGPDRFAAYSSAHSRLTTYVVGPPMLAEAATAFLLVFVRPERIGPGPALLGLVLVGGIWLSTYLLQVPRHTAFASGFDRSAWRSLVASNWLRTVAWTVRGLLVLWMSARVMGL
jgi:hypothetical protein